MSARRLWTRGVLGLAAVALVATVGGALPVWADEGADRIESDYWTAWFADDEVNAGAKTIADSTTFSGSGTFRFIRNSNGLDDRSLRSVTVSGGGDGCGAEVTGTQNKVSSLERTFTYTATSTCNQVVTVTITGSTTTGSLGWPAISASMSSNITFAVPAEPVTSLSATVPDLESRDVTIDWAKPDGTEADATYELQRKAPDSDEWALVGSEENYVDTVEDKGVYQYRVMAKRPLVEAQPSAVVEVGVGVSTPTTTTTTSTTTPDDGSETTITQPDSDGPVHKPSQIGNRRVSSHTTVTAAPRSPSTTIDTGFEETLDYDLDDEEPGELAAEGQSILSNDESSIIGPGAVGAAAMVLVGWAGHFVYFRRLAAQF